MICQQNRRNYDSPSRYYHRRRIHWIRDCASSGGEALFLISGPMKLENEAWRYRKRRSREDVKRLIDELKPADRLAGLTVGTVAVVPCVNDCDVPSGNQIFGDLNFLQSRNGYLRRIDPYICSVAAPFRSCSARALCWRSLFGRRGNWVFLVAQRSPYRAGKDA